MVNDQHPQAIILHYHEIKRLVGSLYAIKIEGIRHDNTVIQNNIKEIEELLERAVTTKS